MKTPKVRNRIQESQEGMTALTDLEPLILLPSKAWTIVHVLDKQSGRFIRTEMDSATTLTKPTSSSFQMERAMSFILSDIKVHNLRIIDSDLHC